MALSLTLLPGTASAAFFVFGSDETQSAAPAPLPESCGQEGEFEARVADCQRKFVDTCEVRLFIPAFKAKETCSTLQVRSSTDEIENATWLLVSKARDGRKVWWNKETGTVWSSTYSQPLSHNRAEMLCTMAGREKAAFTAGLPLQFRLPSNRDFQAAGRYGSALVLQDTAGKTFWSGTRTLTASLLFFRPRKVELTTVLFHEYMVALGEEKNRDNEYAVVCVANYQP